MHCNILEVWRQTGRFEGKSTVRTCLFSVGRHKAVSRRRKKREIALDGEMAANIEDSDPMPDEQAADQNLPRRRQG